MYDEIIDYLKNNLSPGRFYHTLEVAEECKYFTDIFSLDNTERDILHRAALFHDITKEKTPEEQLKLCRVYNIEYDKAYISTPALFHALTGGYYARQLFPALCDEKVIEIITTHTTGCESMTLLQKILFLADSTEKTRKHASCIELRKFFHDSVTDTNKEDLLDRAVIRSLESTISHLMHIGKPIDIMTVRARNYLLKTSEVIK